MTQRHFHLIITYDNYQSCILYIYLIQIKFSNYYDQGEMKRIIRSSLFLLLRFRLFIQNREIVVSKDLHL